MKFRLLGPDNKTQELGLTGARVSIGRSPDNEVVLDDRTISRYHCLVKLDGQGKVVIEDVGSRYGTTVNGVRVEVPTVLSPGDAVVIGAWKGVVFDETLESAAGEDTVLSIPHERKDAQPRETRVLRAQTKKSGVPAGYLVLLAGLAVLAAVVLAFVLLDQG
jgi:pSer/pThr/pTyr-binding forkhead associated (FHA) protein